MNQCPIANLPQKLRIALMFSIISYGLLIASFVVRNLIADNGGWLPWAVQTFSFVIFIPGMLAKHYRTYSWICFVVLMHFLGAVVNVMSPLGLWIDGVQVALLVTLFLAAMMTSRWMQYYQYYYER